MSCYRQPRYFNNFYFYLILFASFLSMFFSITTQHSSVTIKINIYFVPILPHLLERVVQYKQESNANKLSNSNYWNCCHKSLLPLMWNVIKIVETITPSLVHIWSETIASDRLRLSVNSSAIVCDRGRRTMVYSCDRLRLYVNSCAIVCDRVRSRSQAIAGIEPCSIRAIGCDRLRSSAIIYEQSSAIMRLECVP